MMSNPSDRTELHEQIVAECHSQGVATVEALVIDIAVAAALNHAAHQISDALLTEARDWRMRNNTEAGCEWDLAAGWVVGWSVKWGWYDTTAPQAAAAQPPMSNPPGGRDA